MTTVFNYIFGTLLSIGEVGPRKVKVSKDIGRAKKAASKQLMFGLLLNVPLYISAILMGYLLSIYDAEIWLIVFCASCMVIAGINALKNTLDHILQVIIILAASVMDESSWQEFVKAVDQSAKDMK